MSSEREPSSFAEGRAPRSLTLTFAETHPWERLVRDRLNGLPRGYLKRFVLLLIERAELDLSSDEAFCRQVEHALLTRELPRSDEPAAQRPFVVENLPKAAPAPRVVVTSSIDAVPSAATQSPQPAPSVSSSVPAALRKPTPLSKEPGFGALEL
jgi:hypothetical protein